MQNTARHLYRSRHGIWYVRIVVPGDLRGRYPELPRELKRSTQTSQLRAARRFAQQLLGQWLTGISLARLGRTMSSEKDQRLDGIFRAMKVPGLEKPKAPSADPRLLAPMVVEVDMLTNRIKKVETQAHDSPEHVKQMLQALIDQNAAAALERATHTASTSHRPVAVVRPQLRVTASD